jgi:hypothetical protein
MASTYSDLKFELIGTGEQSGTWGTTTNTNLGTAIQEAITGSADVTFASGTVTLTLTNTNASQTARNLRLNLTGTSGGAQDLIVPTIEKFYLVNNGCADAITVKNSTGTGVAVPAGKAMLVFNNGTDVVDAVNHFNTASVGTLTLTNALAVAQGGTGATTADTALDNLGGTTVGKAVFKAANAAAAQQAMDTEVGVDVQAYDAGLTDIAGLAVTDGNIIVGDGTNWVAENGATARTSLGLGSIATQASSSVTITGGSITGITDLAVADGGTGASSFTADNVLLGNGTSAFQVVAPGTSGNVLQSNGTAWVSGSFSAGATPGSEIFTSPGTFTVPSGVTTVKVTTIAGGGNGTSGGTAAGGGGGGAAGLGIEWIRGLSGGTIPVTVGGASGTSSAGPAGSPATTVSSTGGAAAQPQNPASSGGAGGAGGAGSGYGGKGGNGSNRSGQSGGGGGGTAGVYGGTSGTGGAPVQPGNAGTRGGGGGGGGVSGSGGAGGPGLVIFEW